MFPPMIHGAGAKMHEKLDSQPSMLHVLPQNETGREPEGISGIIDANRATLDLVYQDLVGLTNPDTDRIGMTAEQVFRRHCPASDGIEISGYAFDSIDDCVYRLPHGRLSWDIA